MEFHDKPPQKKFDVRIALLTLPEKDARDCTPCLATERAIEMLAESRDVQLTKVVPSATSKDALHAFGITEFKAPVTIIQVGEKKKIVEGSLTVTQLEKEVDSLKNG